MKPKYDNRLAALLQDDVERLIKTINENEELQGISLNDSQFETLGDFASYWEHHINQVTNN